MDINEVIRWLNARKYDDDMILGNKRRIKNNEIIGYLQSLVTANMVIERPKNIPDDPDCPSGACPIR